MLDCASPPYKTAFQAKMRANIDAVPSLLSTLDMQLKVANWAEKYQYPVEDVLAKIVQDPMFAAHFAKDPSKQGLHEEVASRWLSAHLPVQNFQVLPKSAQAFYVYDGKICQGNTERGHDRSTKSIDFAWDMQGLRVYASHKYTHQGGGSQDNQCQDLAGFLIAANACQDPTYRFVAIADGDYYHTNMQDLNITRMEWLQRHIKSPWVFVGSSVEVKAWVQAHQTGVAPVAAKPLFHLPLFAFL